MRVLLLSLVVLWSAFVIAYGTLLSWRPDLFLRFHDFFLDRTSWGKIAPWRKNVYNRDYTVLGGIYVAAGLFFLFIALSRLFSRNP
jgi:hypothetical protein